MEGENNMGILDLFRPKWKNSNVSVRKAAMDNWMDQAALAETLSRCEVSITQLLMDNPTACPNEHSLALHC